MEDYYTETRAYFTLFGEDFPLEEFTREMGIIPTEAYRKGEEFIRGKTKHIRFETAWEYGLDYKMTNDPEEQIHTIVNTLYNSSEIIKKYVDHYNLKCKLVTVVCFNREPTRRLVMNNKAIEFANQVNGEFEFDIYNSAD
ncbi:DUF4279 domain-containing protein [Solibacillus sp. FSL W7-1464]|uniref:DUF4279 domain-containing protein n=1 Tax=Solibacillus sp. FSL W7-1464 TaxID=2921706 RepID=UPI0030FC1A16